MKLRHQILILLIVPIVCQLVSVAVLFQAVTRVDEAVQREARAKEIISMSQELSGLIGRALLEISTIAVMRDRPANLQSGPFLTLLRSKSEKLKALVKGDAKAVKLLAKMDEEIVRFITNWQELGQSYNPREQKMFFAQFYYQDEFVDSMKLLFNNICTDSDALNELYRPMSRELRPEAIAARTNLRNATIAVIASNIFLVFGLAITVNKQTLTRLQMLMNNIRAFSRQQTSFEPLHGRDELAELDKAFREMSNERTRLDEIQKSLRAMVSHDLRSPLTGINISLETIIDNKTDSLDPRTLQSLRRISSETQRLARLARTLLDIEKLEGGRVNVDTADVSCEDVVSDSVNSIIALAERKTIAVNTDLQDGLILHCDRERTVQSLVNLLANAIKFSPKSSNITVRAFAKTPAIARVEVQDQGPGVTHEAQGDLFGKFVQLEQPESVKKEGSGLGLYICRLLIEAQSGSVGFLSGQTGGSCFWFELPASVAEDVSVEPGETALAEANNDLAI
jgi:signal transduction histidine kinase